MCSWAVLYVGIRGAEPPGWAAAEIDECGLALQDGPARPQTWGAVTGRSSSDCAAGAEKLCSLNCRDGNENINKSLQVSTLEADSNPAADDLFIHVLKVLTCPP